MRWALANGFAAGLAMVSAAEFTEELATRLATGFATGNRRNYNPGKNYSRQRVRNYEIMQFPG